MPHLTPGSEETSPQTQPAGQSLRPGRDHVRPAPRVHAPPPGRSRRAPGHLAGAAAGRGRASRSCGLSFLGAPALSAFFPPRALSTASPCPPSRLGLHAGRPDRGTEILGGNRERGESRENWRKLL